MDLCPDMLSVDSVTTKLGSSRKGISYSMLLCIKDGGLEGTGRVRELQLSMRTTEAMVGLLATFSWTHSKPIWTHLMVSLIEPHLNIGSIKFDIAPSLQLFHACKNLTMCTYMSKTRFNFFNFVAFTISFTIQRMI